MNTCMYSVEAKFTLGIILFLWESIKRLEKSSFLKASVKCQQNRKMQVKLSKCLSSSIQNIHNAKNTESDNLMIRNRSRLILMKNPSSSFMNTPIFRLAINYLKKKKNKTP